MSMKIKKGDAVRIIAGSDKGKSGQVVNVDPSTARVVVKGDGLTTLKHFVKPRNAQEKGGIVDKERPVDASNVMVICPACNAATRVAYKLDKNEEGKTIKTRVCKKCGASLDEVKNAKAKATVRKATKSSKAAKKDADTADETAKTTKATKAKAKTAKKADSAPADNE